MFEDKENRGFITGFGSSVPPYQIDQKRVGSFMKKNMLLDERMTRWIDVLIKQSGISHRYSVIPDYGVDEDAYQFFPNGGSMDAFPTTAKRLQYYKSCALPLAASAAQRCLETAQVQPADVTHLIVVSCTGMYAPGLDIDLVNWLGLPTTTSRSCISFMGCYAAFNALKLASAIVGSACSSQVLIVCVELCSLHFQKDGRKGTEVLSNMLFGDGASAALVTNTITRKAPALSILNFASDLFVQGKEEMSWEISDSGFIMKLTREVPEVLKEGVPPLFRRLLDESGKTPDSISHYAFHPGGLRVLSALEEACNITKTDNRWSYQILNDYGNMSSATIFFILEKILTRGEFSENELLFTAAFGPGLTCEAALLSFSNGADER